ncbi:MAG: aspartate-semialdehyde dehydrogenase [Firmicutes bacterium]|nr:aspartate-semialdehyde dehydrogenase [Bacillota bacterium]
MNKSYNIGIVGVTGAVGQELLKQLAVRQFPVAKLRPLASQRSAGQTITWQGQEYTVGLTDDSAFAGLDIVLFAGGAASKQYALAAVNAGAIVIDNSSSFRYDPDVPLITPEVNPQDILWHKGLIANPNCSTIQLVVALKPLHDAAKIMRLNVATYQAVSGAGVEGIKELAEQSAAIAANKPIAPPACFPHQIGFNLIPHIDSFQDNDYTKEEMKIVWETHKMLHDNSIRISATAVRVPVFRSHSEAVAVEFAKSISPQEARNILQQAPGIKLLDEPKHSIYPMPYPLCDTDEVYVGRIRQDIACDNGLLLWVVADQLRKGAATNAVQIAELLITYGLI